MAQEAQTVVTSALLDEEKTFAVLASNDEGGYGLDRRLVKAIAKLGFVYPTLVQSKCIPLALAGKDLLVRARTGSGKTAAFAIPLLQKILKEKEQEGETGASSHSPKVRAVVLVPTRELCDQVKEHMWALMYYCRETVSILSLSLSNVKAQAAQLRDKPDIIVATPAKLLSHLDAGNVNLKDSVSTLVIDEADLVLSYGYNEDITRLVSFLPKICQTFLMSATLSPDLEALKRVVLNNPVVLKLEEGEREGKLQQFYVPVKEKDKYLVLISLLKLGILQGKVLFFVNCIDSCFRLKLFLEKFSINSAVLNAELPHNSRQHIILQYNKGLFDFLIATDDSFDHDTDEEDETDNEGSEEEGEDGNDEEKMKKKASSKKEKEKKKKKSLKKDKSFGVSRGVDFKAVDFVVNVDFPPSVKSYTHRVGRTARGGASGTALSLLSQDSDEEWKLLAAIQDVQMPLPAETVGTSFMQGEVPESGTVAQPSPLSLSLSEIEGFRYRVEDMQRAVTRSAIKDARLQEIKQEVLNSERLKAHFEENPTELQLLRHDRAIGGRVLPHLANVPKYLVPDSVQAVPAPALKKRKARVSKVSLKKRKSNDPLKTFEFSGKSDLLDGAEGEDSGNGAEERGREKTSDKIVSSVDGLGRSTSNRQRWKEKHRKGRYNPQTIAKKEQKARKGWTH